MSGYPLRACLGVAVGRLGWPPESFWAATPVELSAALEARARAEGIDLRRAGPPDRGRLRALIDAAPHRTGSIRRAARREMAGS